MTNKTSKILLMFLGSCPNTTNIINHWIVLNKNNLINNNIYAVVHPLYLDNYKIDSDFKNLFAINNISIVDKNHHIKTEWCKHNIVCATLLMIQYAHLEYNIFFDKYLLLSPVCCPLYSLNEIYDIIIAEELKNKSWFLFLEFNNLYKPDIVNKLFNKIGQKSSQWMIIDRKHIYNFFYNDTTINTYINNEYNIIINPDILNSQEDLNFYNLIHVYKYDNYLKDEINSTDETYFINWILYLSIINNEDNINNCIEENFILFDHNKIDERAKLLNSNLLNKLLNQDLINKNLNIYYIDPYENMKDYIIINNTININLLKNFTFDNISKHDYKNYVTSMTYIDQMCMTYAVNPFSMIRTTNNIINNKLNNLLFLPITCNYLDILTEKINEIEFENKKNPFITISSHPIEFITFSLLNIINVYFIYLILFNNVSDKEYFCDIFNIIKNMFSIESFNLNIYQQFKIIFDKILIKPLLLEKKYGTYITSTYLIRAILHNCLFIRKCMDSSLITEFSNILKTNDKFKITNNLINNFEIKNYVISNDNLLLNNIEYFKKNNISHYCKFKKFGNRYLKNNN
jgi:hypothetical protein